MKATRPMNEIIKDLWNKACDHDGIPRDSLFVVFSEDNKFAKLHNYAMQKALLMINSVSV